MLLIEVVITMAVSWMSLKQDTLLLILLSTVFANGILGQEKQEPVCSRFHYEEMLLEKMIRLEHSTNLMMGEFREIKTQVDNNLAVVNQTTEDMKLSLEEGLQKLRKTSEEVQNEAKGMIEQIKAKIKTSLEQELENQLNEIQTSKGVIDKITGK